MAHSFLIKMYLLEEARSGSRNNVESFNDYEKILDILLSQQGSA
jgi:hypothetical protein